MEPSTTSFTVRHAADSVAVVSLDGDVTPAEEAALMHAYGQAAVTGARSIVLDFSDLSYMNSGGIGLLVTLLVRAQRDKHELMAFGLTDHYRQILSLTRLDEAIRIFDDEATALAAAS
ncbi:STAS domain-containing protein [Nitriliruptor alkaliphilus]|uniref:STAS domain-containing protein n=1 Tax=Nitriliruptor alkaliphilus TaxID=427918 RepID=UPI000698421B|nr:STAS domain-containing protein [Nitriliruptor alkaliphilus]